jgi:hypothetical protein
MSNAVRNPLAVPIAEAAKHVGLSRGQFYREFLKSNPPRVAAVPTGKRDRIILVDELEAAFARYVAEKRAPAQPAAA